MNFEPQKLFVGLVDFFSILMPGAMLAYLGKDWLAERLGIAGGFPLHGAEASMVFLFSSYLLGHFIFLISSVLDDWVYDPIRGWTDWGQISKRLAQGHNLTASWKRRLACSTWLFDTNADAAVMQAQRIKARALQGLSAGKAINAFQWSKTRLTKDLAEGLLTVQRFEADSKFFRSFVVVLGILTLFYASQGKWLAFLSLGAVAPALWRYIDQRFKATQQAYWFVITLGAEESTVPALSRDVADLTHAGGIVYRRTEKEIEFLLVQAEKDRTQWVLPKGHIEPGEDPRSTAVREVKEETGFWARFAGWREDAPLDNTSDAPRVRWFLLEFVENADEWRDEDRQHVWLALAEAKQKATFKETCALLDRAAADLASFTAPCPRAATASSH